MSTKWSNCKLKTEQKRRCKQRPTCPIASNKSCPVKSFCSLEHFMLLSLLYLLPQTLSSSSAGGNCCSSIEQESPTCALPRHTDKRDFCRTPLSIGFLCFMRSAQGTGRIRGSDNRTSCSKIDSDNLPENIQIYLSALYIILNLNLITAISSGLLSIHYYPVYHPLFDIYFCKMKMTFGLGR